MDGAWGWQPAIYLFFGGLGGGTFLMCAVLYLLDQKNHREILCHGFWAAALSVLIGLACLLLDLTNPLRGLLVWESFTNATSWMTLGAWGALFALGIFGASAVLSTPPFFLRLRKVRIALTVAGIAAALFLTTYTGMLLMDAAGIPFWNTPLLPCLFVASSANTGTALISVLSLIAPRRAQLKPRAVALLNGVTLVLILVELVLIGGMVGGALALSTDDPTRFAAAASASILVSGELSQSFWLTVVGIGLVVPLAIALDRALCRRITPYTSLIAWIESVGTLIGGYQLRFLILAAGLHANLVATALLNM